MRGYISEYKKTRNVNEKISNEIFLAFYTNVLDDVFKLIESGYDNYLSDEKKKFEADETVITAGLCGHIENIVELNKLPFDVVPEYYIYTKDIKSGKVNPNKAKRFDIRILTWNKQNQKLKFGVEAKLLSEFNYKTKKASYLINEYIGDKGMGKFINRLYDESAFNEGFMIGHVLNGSVNSIVEKLNEKITKIYTKKEKLNFKNEKFSSTYSDKEIRKKLYHIFLNFSTLAN